MEKSKKYIKNISVKLNKETQQKKQLEEQWKQIIDKIKKLDNLTKSK